MLKSTLIGYLVTIGEKTDLGCTTTFYGGRYLPSSKDGLSTKLVKSNCFPSSLETP